MRIAFWRGRWLRGRSYLPTRSSPCSPSIHPDRPDPAHLTHMNVALEIGMDILSAPQQQKPILQLHERQKLDQRPDTEFYTQPCTAYHTDAAFRGRLQQLFLATLQRGWRVLDLCSSFSSFLPSEQLALEHVTGLGLNLAELQMNPTLNETLVHDLNQAPQLPFPPGSFNALLCSSGVQNLQQPEAIALEAYRVLSPGGVTLWSFSTHCYTEKAIVGWLERSSYQRVQLVVQLLAQAGFVRLELFICPEAKQHMSEQHSLDGAWHFTTTLLLPADDNATSSAGGMQGAQPTSAGTEHAGSTAKDAFFAVRAWKPQMPTDQRQAPWTDSANVAARTDMKTDESWRYLSPALHEVEILSGSGSGTGHQGAEQADGNIQGGSHIGEDTLERWCIAYAEMTREAEQLGIPASAIPQLPPGCRDVEQIKKARDHLQGMIGSFLSAGL